LYVPHIMPHVPIFASKAFHGTSQRGLYGDVVQELDWSIGEILAAIDKQGLTEKTIVIFMSDNGPFLSYGEHAGSSGPLREGKLTTFEGGVRVPCIVRWPGHIPAERVSDEMACTMDLFVTLSRWAGAELPPRKLDGLDMTEFLTHDGAKSPRSEFWYYSGDELHAIRRGRWKLHLPHEYLTVAAEPGKGGKPSNFGRLAPQAIELSGIRGIASRHGYRVERLELSLFDVQTDVAETKNVAADHPQVVKDLLAIAEQARADLGDALTKRNGSNVRPCGRWQQQPAP
jgi:arylsulfatase A-like enzyme